MLNERNVNFSAGLCVEGQTTGSHEFKKTYSQTPLTPRPQKKTPLIINPKTYSEYVRNWWVSRHPSYSSRLGRGGE
jgi:hypothetical protein